MIEKLASFDDVLAGVLGDIGKEPEVKSKRYGREEFPYSLVEFVGNEKACKLTTKLLHNNKISQIYHGSPGVGKTLLAELTAIERGGRLFKIEGDGLTSIKLQGILLEANRSKNAVVFIDEIHGLELGVEEKLYSVIQDKKFHVVEQEEHTLKYKNKHIEETRKFLSEDRKQKVIEISDSVKFIGATTLMGEVSEPLRRRMLPIMLQPYSAEELTLILNNLYQLDDDATEELVKNSDGTPRFVKLICTTANDGDKNKKISKEDIINMLELLDIVGGLSYNHRKALEILAKYKEEQMKVGKKKYALGVRTLATMLRVDPEEVQIEIEPVLFNRGYVIITSGGRMITSLGEEYLNGI